MRVIFLCITTTLLAIFLLFLGLVNFVYNPFWYLYLLIIITLLLGAILSMFLLNWARILTIYSSFFLVGYHYIFVMLKFGRNTDFDDLAWGVVHILNFMLILLALSMNGKIFKNHFRN